MTTSRYLTVLENHGTVVAVGSNGAVLPEKSVEVEVAAKINMHILETHGDLVITLEVGSRRGSHLFTVDFSGMVDCLVGDNQKEDGSFPDPEDAVRSLELLARRLELEASLLRSKVANSIYFSPNRN